MIGSAPKASSFTIVVWRSCAPEFHRSLTDAKAHAQNIFALYERTSRDCRHSGCGGQPNAARLREAPGSK
jgi:hypothetical protein